MGIHGNKLRKQTRSLYAHCFKRSRSLRDDRATDLLAPMPDGGGVLVG